MRSAAAFCVHSKAPRCAHHAWFMGICLAKQSASKDCSVKSAGSSKVVGDGLTVSLERAKALASNAVAISARYHCCGQGDRRLNDDYEVLPQKVLGEGCNGLVVMATGRHDDRKYALKKIQKSKVQAKALKQLTAEVEIYLTLDHPHIAALRDVYETETEIALLTECCEGGELYARLSTAGTYAEADAAEATRQMLLAVGYLHAHNVVHRDLKLENFLYESKEDKAPLKLIDFGFAKVWDPSTLMMASCGSIAYVSPDVLKCQGYTNKCDMWSLGVIVFMLLVGYPPFHGSEKDMRANIMGAKVDWSHKSRWKNVSQEALDFVKCLLVKEPAQRLDAKEALNHRWLAAARSSKQAPLLNKDALRSLRRYADASRVRRAVLQLLAQELAPDETRELRTVFLDIDKSGHGTIRLADLKEAIRGTRGGQSPTRSPVSSAGYASPKTPKTPASQLRRSKSEVIDRLFQVIDSNSDEQIYYSDFLAATLDARSRLRQETVRAAFHRLDADSSGTISADDMRKVIGATFEGVDVELLVREADTAGKGEVGFNDFIRILDLRDAMPTADAQQQAGQGS